MNKRLSLAPAIVTKADTDDKTTICDAKLSWYKENDLKRVSTLSDGGSFLHAVLKACSNTYRSNSTVIHRNNMVKVWRDELSLNDDMKFHELHGKIVNAIDKHIHVIQLWDDGKYVPHVSSSPNSDNAKHIIIIQVADKYELLLRCVTIADRVEYQTMFDGNDEVIIGLISRLPTHTPNKKFKHILAYPLISSQDELDFVPEYEDEC